MTLSDDELKSRATTRFATLRSLCYPDRGPTGAWRPVETFSNSTTTNAMTNGYRLTKIDLSHFRAADIETQFVTLLHEVTHANDGGGYGKGISAHSPTFWEEFQKNFNKIVDSTKNRTVVESLFSEGGVTFDWRRAKYRAVQHVSQVDERSETVAERRQKLGDALDYDGYADFEDGDWGLHKRREGMVVPNDPAQVNLFIPTQRFADDYSDDELLEFVEDNGGHAPAPLVILDREDWRTDGPQIVRDDNAWELYFDGRIESQKALAAQERLGQGYHALSVECLLIADDAQAYESACPIPVEDIRPARVAAQK